MGGNAFMHHYTPRMSTDVYNIVVQEVVARLQTKFATVIVPPGLPGKSTHGDIDVYVGGPLGGKLLTVKEVQETLGAFESNNSKEKNSWSKFTSPTLRPNILLGGPVLQSSIRHTVSSPPSITSCSKVDDFKSATSMYYVSDPKTVANAYPLPAYFALRWPQDLLSKLPPRPDDLEVWTKNPETDGADIIQVDFQQEKSPIVAEWHAFWTCYGCLRPILGYILRDAGLHLRQKPDNKINGVVVAIECLENAVRDGTLNAGKKWTEVLLTVDPSEFLRFLGMLQDGQKWDELAFASKEDLAYFICSKNRFFDADKTERYQSDYEAEITRFRDSDKYYEFFKYWVMEYLPENQDMLKSGELAHLSRTEIEKKVMNFFIDAGIEIEEKILVGRIEYEPRRFRKSLEAQLRTLTAPEVLQKYDSEHRMQYLLYCVKKRVPQPILKLINMDKGFPQSCTHHTSPCLEKASDRLSDDVRTKLNGLINVRVSRVMRRVEEDMNYFTGAMVPVAPDYDLWTAAKYDQLLQLSIENRVQLEEEQRVKDKINFEAHKRRKEFMALQSQTK